MVFQVHRLRNRRLRSGFPLGHRLWIQNKGSYSRALPSRGQRRLLGKGARPLKTYLTYWTRGISLWFTHESDYF